MLLVSGKRGPVLPVEEETLVWYGRETAEEASGVGFELVPSA
jgi:hypothetical protein